MKQDEKAVELWNDCQQNLIRIQSRYGHDTERLEEARKEVYGQYYNSIDLENKRRQLNEFLAEINCIKEDIDANRNISTDYKNNRGQLSNWRSLIWEIEKSAKEGEKILNSVMSADFIVQYKNGLKILNQLKSEVQSEIDNFVLVKNKFTKELAIEYSKNKPTINWSDEECDYHDYIISWFVDCIADDMYGDNEIVEIAKLIN